MPPQQQQQQPQGMHHSPLTPTTSSSSMINNTPPEPPPEEIHSFLKPSFISWKVLGGIFATMLVVGWVFIIVILIQEEKWQLVLVAWLLLYAAAHFCYWYFKRHHLLSLHSQICGRVRGNVGSVVPIEKGPDAPPSYDDIIKSEAPPPTYKSVVVDSPKSGFKPPSPGRFPLFFQGLPRVFGKSSSPSSSPSPPSSSSSSSSLPSSSSGLASSASTSSTSSSLSTSSGLKQAEEGKCPLAGGSMCNPPPSISASFPEQSYSWKSFGGSEPPPYTDSFVDTESQVIPSHTPSSPPSPTRRSSTRSISRAENVINDGLHPIFSPIYKNTSPPPSGRGRPHSSQQAVLDMGLERDRNCSTSST